MNWRRRVHRLAAMALLAGVLAGCSSYTGLSEKTRPFIVRRDYTGALAQLEGVDGGKDRVLVLLERGLLHHYNGDFAASNEVFQQAEDLIDELYTKSVSTEAASFLTSDLIKPYDGAEFERVMVNVYRALNYVALDQPQSALVEARKANLNLQLYTQDLEDPAYGDDPFVEYFTGLLYEWGGEVNDGLVSYRRAIDAYEAAHARGGPPVPASLVRSAIGTARRLGFPDEVEALEARFPSAGVPVREPGEGEVIVVMESGFVPVLRETRADVPILKTDEVGGDHFYHVAGDAYHRIGHRDRYEKTKIAYILSIAFPVFVDEPQPVRSVALVSAAPSVGDDAPVATGSAPGSLPEVGLSLERVSDLAFNARENFEDRESTILIRTIARALVKYVAKKQAQDQGGTALGLAVDIFGSLTERADVRSWRSLPHDVYLMRESLPAGVHDLVFESRGTGGRVVERVTLRGVEVVDGETTWVSHRLF